MFIARLIKLNLSNLLHIYKYLYHINGASVIKAMHIFNYYIRWDVCISSVSTLISYFK